MIILKWHLNKSYIGAIIDKLSVEMDNIYVYKISENKYLFFFKVSSQLELPSTQSMQDLTNIFSPEGFCSVCKVYVGNFSPDGSVNVSQKVRWLDFILFFLIQIICFPYHMELCIIYDRTHWVETCYNMPLFMHACFHSVWNLGTTYFWQEYIFRELLFFFFQNLEI